MTTETATATQICDMQEDNKDSLSEKETLLSVGVLRQGGKKAKKLRKFSPDLMLDILSFALLLFVDI